MARAQPDPDFRSIVDSAAANWYSQRSNSPSRSQSVRSDLQPAPTQSQKPAETQNIRSDITAWESALQSLPAEFQSNALPMHPLSQALAGQPTLRPVEWNRYRQQGGFVPRTAHDYSSLMIFISGQVNPNPCRNCLMKNGPFGRCIVAPPSVLVQSTLRHACANCTYQNQYRKCTNEPISHDEMLRIRLARGALKVKEPVIARPPIPRKPKTHTRGKMHKQDFGHMVRKPTSQSITDDSFSEKLKQARSWSPRSRRRMKAEASQWQAAILTIEAERTRTSSKEQAPETRQFSTIVPPPQNITTSSAVFAGPSSMGVPQSEMEDEESGDEDDLEQMEDESESGEEQEYEGTSWVGIEDMGPVLKPPH